MNIVYFYKILRIEVYTSLKYFLLSNMTLHQNQSSQSDVFIEDIIMEGGPITEISFQPGNLFSYNKTIINKHLAWELLIPIDRKQVNIVIQSHGMEGEIVNYGARAFSATHRPRKNTLFLGHCHS